MYLGVYTQLAVRALKLMAEEGSAPPSDEIDDRSLASKKKMCCFSQIASGSFEGISKLLCEDLGEDSY